MVVTDSRLATMEPVQAGKKSVASAGVEAIVFDRTSVEPNDASFLEAAAFAKESGFDGFVAIGGSSVIDTAKVANPYSTYPADLLEYANQPIGRRTPVPGPLKPHIAVPTTCGTDSETTGVAILDLTQ